MADDRIIITNDRIYTIPEGVEGIPVEEAWPGAVLSPFVKGAKLYPTPQGPVIAHAEPLQGANDPIPEKPVVFPSREEQIRRRDAEFWARLERRYEKVNITAQPMRLFGAFQQRHRETGERRRRNARPADAAFPGRAGHGGDRPAGGDPLPEDAAETPAETQGRGRRLDPEAVATGMALAFVLPRTWRG